MKRLAAAWLCAWAAAAAAAQLSVSVRTSQDEAVRDAVVWVVAVEGAAVRTAGTTAEIVQRDREFEPFVTVVSTGSRVFFPNRDKVRHHVYSFSAAKSFEIQLYSGLPAEPVTFDKAGVVVIGCNIHDWMMAYIAVVESPWFTKSAADGRGELMNLPAGRYRVNVWHPHEKTGSTPQVIDIAKPSAHRELKLVLDIAPPPRRPRPTGGDTY